MSVVFFLKQTFIIFSLALPRIPSKRKINNMVLIRFSHPMNSLLVNISICCDFIVSII